jgi:hypothetical protein
VLRAKNGFAKAGANDAFHGQRAERVKIEGMLE